MRNVVLLVTITCLLGCAKEEEDIVSGCSIPSYHLFVNSNNIETRLREQDGRTGGFGGGTITKNVLYTIYSPSFTSGVIAGLSISSTQQNFTRQRVLDLPGRTITSDNSENLFGSLFFYSETDTGLYSSYFYPSQPTNEFTSFTIESVTFVREESSNVDLFEYCGYITGSIGKCAGFFNCDSIVGYVPISGSFQLPGTVTY